MFVKKIHPIENEFVTSNEEFVARWFGYSSKYELFEDTCDVQALEQPQTKWLFLTERRLGDKRVSLRFPNGSKFGPWKIKIEYDFPRVNIWANSDHLPGDWGQCRKLPAHIARRLFPFDGEKFSVDGTTIIRDLSPNRWVYLDLSFDEEGELVIDCNVIDQFEFEGPVRLDEDMPF